MSQFDDTYVPHINELLGTTSKAKTEGKRCDYCERGWSKGFHTCPQCGLEKPPSCDDCEEYLEDGECPECSES